MKQADLQHVVPGFDDPVAGSQAVFRHALQALSLPGRVVTLPRLGRLPAGGQAAAASLWLALLDSDCTLWLSASLRDADAPAWLRFHTGCRIVDELSQARFVWLAAGDAWPGLSEMAAGSDEYPDQSATCVMEMSRLQADAGGPWQLSGPGILGTQGLHAQGLPDDFVAQWQANHAAFPRGVDVFLTTATELVGLPRSTRLQRNDTVEA
jgi:alpha-D-ribose 1-methylphosphonate 5-triphosphate synthase subunit PhnH